MNTIRALSILGATASLLLLGGCSSNSSDPAGQANSKIPGTKLMVSVDGPSYNSVDGLATKASVVIDGTFQGVIERTSEGEFTGNSPTPEGLPLAIWNVHVNETLQGSADSSDILVERIDTDRVDADAIAPVTAGSETVLFLIPSGLQHDGQPVYTVVGLDQGRLDVASNGDLSTDTGTTQLANDLDSVGTVDDLQEQLSN